MVHFLRDCNDPFIFPRVACPAIKLSVSLLRFVSHLWLRAISISIFETSQTVRGRDIVLSTI